MSGQVITTFPISIFYSLLSRREDIDLFGNIIIRMYKQLFMFLTVLINSECAWPKKSWINYLIMKT